MPRPTARYLLIATGALAVCIAIYKASQNQDSEILPYSTYHILMWWPIQAVNFIVGIGIVMHVLTSLLGLAGWPRWLTAILAPTCGFTAWYSVSVRVLGYHPGSINEWGYIQAGILGSAAGFGIVSFVVALPKLRATNGIETSIVGEDSSPEP